MVENCWKNLGLSGFQAAVFVGSTVFRSFKTRERSWVSSWVRHATWMSTDYRHISAIGSINSQYFHMGVSKNRGT